MSDTVSRRKWMQDGFLAGGAFGVLGMAGAERLAKDFNVRKCAAEPEQPRRLESITVPTLFKAVLRHGNEHAHAFCCERDLPVPLLVSLVQQMSAAFPLLPPKDEEALNGRFFGCNVMGTHVEFTVSEFDGIGLPLHTHVRSVFDETAARLEACGFRLSYLWNPDELNGLPNYGTSDVVINKRDSCKLIA